MKGNRPLKKKLNRRECLKTAAAAGAACFMPTIIPASAPGAMVRSHPASGSWSGPSVSVAAASTI